MSQNKKAYYQGTEEPAPKKKKYKSEKAIVDQVRFEEPFYKSLGLEKEEDVINEIKALRERKPEEIKFNDDQSKHIYELLREGGDKKKDVLKYLATHEKIETLISADVTKENAADIVKFGMLLKSKSSGSELTDFEINRLFNRKFQMPEKPSLEDVKADTSIPAEDEDKVYQDRLNNANFRRYSNKGMVCI